MENRDDLVDTVITLLIGYRCFVPGCDDAADPVYDNNWVHVAVPGKFNGEGVFSPEFCEKFSSNYDPGNASNCSSIEFGAERNTCDRWVFDKHEKTIVEEVREYCILIITITLITSLWFSLHL